MLSRYLHEMQARSEVSGGYTSMLVCFSGIFRDFFLPLALSRSLFA